MARKYAPANPFSPRKLADHAALRDEIVNLHRWLEELHGMFDRGVGDDERLRSSIRATEAAIAAQAAQLVELDPAFNLSAFLASLEDERQHRGN